MAKSKVVSFSDKTSYDKAVNKILESIGLSDIKKKAESPIEKALGYALAAEIPVFSRTFFIANMSISAQNEHVINDKKYRTDLEIHVEVDGGDRVYIIECDGHDFHEKTKEQAQRDKSRDRAFISSGSTVIRFTGSEINRDVDACVEEVFKIIERDIIPQALWIRN